MLDIKNNLLQLARQTIEESLTTLRRATAEADANSKSAESKAESKYDTRGLEASYLAEGQREQLAILEANVAKLERLVVVDEPDTVIVGSLIVISFTEGEENYLLLPVGAGLEIRHKEVGALVITPASPLGSEMIGKALGDQLSLEGRTNAYVSEIY